MNSNNKMLIAMSSLIGIVIFLNVVIYQPLPDHFEQPWKYRLICFGANILNYLGGFLEANNIIHRLNLTRLAYHVSIGLFNIRDQNDNIHVSDEYIDNILIRKYKPNNNQSPDHKNLMPTIIFFHGGGYFLGSADVIEPMTYLFSKYTNSLVIYVEYRLIPEHKYPAALTDSLMVTKHLINNNLKYSIDLNNLILMGDSAGGNLAAVISQKLIESNLARPRMQVLIYPILQFFDFTLPSYRINLPKKILGNIDHENFKNFIHYFTGYKVDDTIFLNGHTSQSDKESHLSKYVNINHLPDKFNNSFLKNIKLLNSTMSNKLSEILLNKEVSPLLVDDEYLFNNTPQITYLLTTEIDILRDDGFIYAKRLEQIGKIIHHVHYDYLFHGILGLLHGPLKFDKSHQMLIECANFINSIIYI